MRLILIFSGSDGIKQHSLDLRQVPWFFTFRELVSCRILRNRIEGLEVDKFFSERGVVLKKDFKRKTLKSYFGFKESEDETPGESKGKLVMIFKGEASWKEAGRSDQHKGNHPGGSEALGN